MHDKNKLNMLIILIVRAIPEDQCNYKYKEITFFIFLFYWEDYYGRHMIKL